jgi:hypothetical protein
MYDETNGVLLGEERKMSSHQFDEVAPLGVARVRLNPAGRVSPGSKPISLTNYTKPPKLCKEDCKSPSKNISTALAILRVNISNSRFEKSTELNVIQISHLAV